MEAIMKKENDFFPEEESPAHSSDYSMEVLLEDSFEDRPPDDEPWEDNAHEHHRHHRHHHHEHGRGHKHKHSKKKRSMKRWKKVLIGVVAFIVVGTTGLAGGFFYLRAQGEKNLKTNVAAAGNSETAREGLYITHNGKEYQYNEDVINFLCLGIDKDIPIEEKRFGYSEGLADAIILISINVETGQIKLLAIPRDTIVPVKVLDKAGYFLKNEDLQITLQYMYGETAADSCELMLNTVSDLLYKVPIQRYCSINFQAIPILNDAIGGVDVQVLEDISGATGNYRTGDTIHLAGNMALDYVRERDTNVFGSSMGRLERQKQYITNYFATAKNAVKNDMALPVTIYQSLQGNMCTNISVEDIAYLVPKLLDVSLTAEDMTMIPGEIIQPDEHEQYIVNKDQLKEVVLNFFYKEVG